MISHTCITELLNLLVVSSFVKILFKLGMEIDNSDITAKLMQPFLSAIVVPVS